MTSPQAMARSITPGLANDTHFDDRSPGIVAPERPLWMVRPAAVDPIRDKMTGCGLFRTVPRNLSESNPMPRKPLRPLAIVGILVFLVAVVGCKPATSGSPLPTRSPPRRCHVVSLLEKNHMAQPKIDDEMAKKWCKNFLKELDPQKNYFLKDDVDEFLAQATTLDDKIKEGNLDFARLVFDRFLKRSDERLAPRWSCSRRSPTSPSTSPSSTIPTSSTTPPTPRRPKERWRKQIKFDLLQLKIVDKIDDDEAVKKLKIRYRDRNRIVHQFDMSDLLEVYLSA